METYYNENDAHAAEWLGNLAGRDLIGAGRIDTRSIKDVIAADLAGFRRCHFFAGIGGWDRALQLAGWQSGQEVWTGSCPCQPFSTAGKRKGTADDRHLWPEFFRLIRECRPAIVFGEQVAGKDGLGWLDGVFSDMEGIGYACGAADLPAASVSAAQKRQRLFWVASADGIGEGAVSGIHAEHGTGSAGIGGVAGSSESRLQRGEISGASRRCEDARSRGILQSKRDVLSGPMEHATGNGRDTRRPESIGWGTASRCGTGGLGDSNCGGYQKGRSAATGDGYRPPVDANGGVDTPDHFIHCSDGKTRRTESGIQPLAHAIPRDMGRGQPELGRMAKRARSNRTGRLRGYGNAIVPDVAAVFVRAVMDCLEESA